MTLQLIGAGLPRTGTSSLREALGHLLEAPVYHMSEVFAHPEHADTWVRAINGSSPDWGRFLAGYAAGVDVPFATCWRDLASAFPDALVLLSEREDAEVWYRSMAATVLPRTRQLRARDRADPVVALSEVMFDGILGDLEDRDGLLADYERWGEQVRAATPPERLVVWKPGDGWGPLCEALGVPVPTVPFPHENSTSSFLARQEERARKDEIRAASSSPLREGPHDTTV